MEKFPEEIQIQGTKIKILTDFRAVFTWSKMIQSALLTPYEKSIGTVELFCCSPVPSVFYKEALEGVLEFIQCGEEVIEETDERTLDFSQDFPYLWAAFDQYYHVDLNTIKMHWWVFRYRFNELPDTTRIKQIMQIRGMQPDFSSLSTKDFHELMTLKEKYALE